MWYGKIEMKKIFTSHVHIPKDCNTSIWNLSPIFTQNCAHNIFRTQGGTGQGPKSLHNLATTSMLEKNTRYLDKNLKDSAINIFAKVENDKIQVGSNTNFLTNTTFK